MTNKTNKCYDCGMNGPVAIIPNNIWDVIRPEGGEALCLKCTCNRLSSAGYSNVKGFIETPHNVYGPLTLCCGPMGGVELEKL